MRKVITELKDLALLRRQYGYTQSDLITKGGFSQKVVQKHEALDNPFEVMTMKQLRQYAKFYGMTPIDFYRTVNAIAEKRQATKLV